MDALEELFARMDGEDRHLRGAVGRHITWGELREMNLYDGSAYPEWIHGVTADEHGCDGGWAVRLHRYVGGPWRFEMARTARCRINRDPQVYGTWSPLVDTHETDLESARQFAEREVSGLRNATPNDIGGV